MKLNEQWSCCYEKEGQPDDEANTDSQAEPGRSQRNEPGLLDEITHPPPSKAEFTVGFPVRRVREYSSLLIRCELGFLLPVSQSFLNDKANALALLRNTMFSRESLVFPKA